MLGLIWAQQKVAAGLQPLLPENKQGCLFSYQRILHYKKGRTSQAGVANNIIQSFVEYHFKRICGDVTGCKSDMWNCLACGHFIPDSSQKTYFEGQVIAWKEKAKRFEQMYMVRDNAIRNAGLFEAILEKIRIGNIKDE